MLFKHLQMTLRTLNTLALLKLEGQPKLKRQINIENILNDLTDI